MICHSCIHHATNGKRSYCTSQEVALRTIEGKVPLKVARQICERDGRFEYFERKEIMKIYIAGKITGCNAFEAEQKFAKAEMDLKAAGHRPVNPMAKVSEQYNYSWADYMKEDIPLLLVCDAIYLLPDWNESKGARLEKHIAEELGMNLIYAELEKS